MTEIAEVTKQGQIDDAKIRQGFVFLGPPTSGKTSHTMTFAEILGAKLIRGREILPDLASQHEGSRSLIPDSKFLPALARTLIGLEQENSIRYFFDNIPRTAPQAEMLVDWSHKLGLKINTVVLSLSEDEVRYRFETRTACPKCNSSYHPLLKPSRVEGRCDKDLAVLVPRSGDKEENVARSYRAFELMSRKVVPVLEGGGYVYHVSAVGSIAVTASRIVQALQFIRQT